MPPIITNSPWAKFITSKAVDDVEAKSDQRIDRSDRQTGKGELQKLGHSPLAENP